MEVHVIVNDRGFKTLSILLDAKMHRMSFKSVTIPGNSTREKVN